METRQTNNASMEALTPESLAEFQMRQSEYDRIDADPTGWGKYHGLLNFSMCAAIRYRGIILGIIGYYELWPGTFEVWAFPSIYVEQYATVYLRIAKQYVKATWETQKPFRMQTTTLADDVHDRWMRFLGFSNPVDLECYSVLRENFRIWSILSDREET